MAGRCNPRPPSLTANTWQWLHASSRKRPDFGRDRVSPEAGSRNRVGVWVRTHAPPMQRVARIGVRHSARSAERSRARLSARRTNASDQACSRGRVIGCRRNGISPGIALALLRLGDCNSESNPGKRLLDVQDVGSQLTVATVAVLAGGPIRIKTTNSGRVSQRSSSPTRPFANSLRAIRSALVALAPWRISGPDPAMPGCRLASVTPRVPRRAPAGDRNRRQTEAGLERPRRGKRSSTWLPVLARADGPRPKPSACTAEVVPDQRPSSSGSLAALLAGAMEDDFVFGDAHRDAGVRGS